MKEKRNTGFWESLRVILKTAGVITRMDWKNIPAFVGNQFFLTIHPFVTLYFSARILDVLAAGAQWESCVKWVIAGLACNYGVYLLERLTACMNSVEGITLYWQLYQEMSRVMMRADYEELEGTEIREAKERIERSAQMFWYGPWEVPGVLMSVAQGLTITLVSFILAWPVLLPGRGGDISWGVFGVLLLIAGTVIYSLTSEKKLYRLKENSLDKQSAEYRLESFLYDYAEEQNGAKDIRLYRQQDMIWSRYDHNTQTIRQIAARRRSLQAKIYGVRGALAQSVSYLAYLIVGIRALSGAFPIGSIVQYVGAITRLSEGIRVLVYSVQQIKMQGPHCREYLDFIGEGGEKEKYAHRQDGSIDVAPDVDYVFEFDHVCFCYPGTEKPALQDVSLTLKKGEHYAIVGMNGSGKTTFIKLLCRLYEPTEGRILLNGIDIREYRYEQYRKLFSVVFQDFCLMSFPLGENVAADIQYDEERVMDCLDKAGTGKWAQSLPQKLRQPLYLVDQDGVNVSGGEAQKIAIARALYKGAPFVILDEPTAALDPLAEAEIYTRFRDLVEGKGAIYISHRLSSCRFCDTIAVFHEGRLVQLGGHEKLLADKGGKYAELWQAQAQYYQENDRKQME